MSGHHHGHAHDQHGHARHGGNSNALLWGVGLTASFAIVEAIGGWLSSSLALLGDAGHMITDASALGLAAFAAWLSRLPVTDRHSYGMVRAEVVAALINGVFMVVVVMTIAWHAVERFITPQDVAGQTVMIIAAIGLCVNLLVAYHLHRGENTLNTRAAFLHVMGDLLGSVAALVAGLVIYLTGWMPIDPILSLLICALILMASVRLLREALHIIMEGVPQSIDYAGVGNMMAAIDNVTSIHDLHIWTVASGQVALSAHVLIKDMQCWDSVLTELQTQLMDKHEISHVTLQPEIFSHNINVSQIKNATVKHQD